MKLKYLLIVTAAFYIINAIISLLVPTIQLSLYGISNGPGASYMARWAGLGSLVIGLIAFFSRNVIDRKSQWALVPSLLVYWVIAAVLSLFGRLSGAMNEIAWLFIVVCLLFTALYGYMLFRIHSTA